MNHQTLERVTTAAILANAGLLVWGMLDPQHAEMAETIEHGTLLIFSAEMAVRLRAARWKPRGWLAFDLAVIVVSVALLLAPLGTDTAALRVMRLASRAGHMGRHAATLLVTATGFRRVRAEA